MKKAIKEVAKVLLSLTFGYILATILLTPLFLVLWGTWSWDAAIHFAPVLWSLLGMIASLFFWNEL